MRLAQILITAALVFSPIGAIAQPASDDGVLRGSIAVVPGPPPTVSAPTPDPKAGTFVTVKDGATTVSGGSVIGELLMWAALVLGVPLSGALLKYVIIPFEKKMGVEVSAQNSARLQQIVENGIALAAQRAQVSLKDKLEINVRSDVAVNALQYVQDHGKETLALMGAPDPTDPKAMEALQARIARAMDDKLGAVNVAATVASTPPATSL